MALLGHNHASCHRPPVGHREEMRVDGEGGGVITKGALVAMGWAWGGCLESVMISLVLRRERKRE